MLRHPLLTLLLLSLSACQSPPPLLGGQRDNHGCLSGAGYQWANVAQRCIRLFETAIRLEPLDSQQISSAFVLFSQDKQRVEIFLPERTQSALLGQQISSYDWQGQDIELKKAPHGYQLYQQGMLRYQSIRSPAS